MDGSRVPMQNRHMATFVTQAKQNWGLNAEDTVDITVESATPQVYDIGDTITIFGRDYKLNRLPSVKKTGLRQFQYDMQFEGVQYDLMRAFYDVTVDTTNNQLQDVHGDSLTGNLKRFMDVLVANANRVFPGKWALGACPDTIGDKTLTFGESDNCLSVLQNLCGESNFKVEFDIVQTAGVYTINLYERVGQTLPYRFAYGKGKGLYELNRQNVSSANIVTRLKVYGSTENITHKYRADRLCLPGKSKGMSYIEKPEMVAKYGVFEGRKNFDDIKPTFTGKVESKVDEFSFIDETFPFDLNAKNGQGETLYLINGKSAKIHFNTGNLAGYEFEVKSYNSIKRQLTLIKQTDDRGDIFPSEASAAFQFAEGDEYKVLDIAYSPDIEAEAEARLEEVANEYYNQNCQPKVQYGLSVTKEYLESFLGGENTIANVFAPGDYLHIIDADIAVDKAIRIKSFCRNVLDPYEYTLVISDSITNATIANRVISELVELDKVVTINNLKDPARSRSNWRTNQELMNMIFDPDGNYYTEKIKPNSIDTLALSVGAKSMQFSLTGVVFDPYTRGASVLMWTGGVLTHYAIDEDKAVSWNMAAGGYGLLDYPYYIYAKCQKNGDEGSFVPYRGQMTVDEDANYYHFLVGTLSSIDPDLNTRSLSLMYGFTTVNGRYIKAGCITSKDGSTYFDLDRGEIHGKILFTESKKTIEELGFDNTKTAIDGGLVTSGTIQVAGDEQTVLAGITGQDTADNSIRFWAGESFDNRAEAPFRVAQDGSVVMTKANVEGNVTATGGTIGGFGITGSRIGVGTSSNGMTLMDDFIKFAAQGLEDDERFVAIGSNCNALSTGFPCLGRFEYTDTADWANSVIALHVKARPNKTNFIYTQRAIHCDGNYYGVGGAAQFYDCYVGPANDSYIMQNYIERTHYFHFTSVPSSGGINMYLPTKEQIEAAAGTSNMFFDIHISANANTTFWLYPGSGTKIYNYKCENQNYVPMFQNKIISFRYYNGVYTTIAINW